MVRSSIRVLISQSSVFKRGAWGRTFPLAKALAENHCDVTILTTNPRLSLIIKVVVIDGVKIVIFPEVIPARITSMGYGLLSFFFKVIYSLTSRYDITYSDAGHRPNGGIPCIIQKVVYKTPYVTEWFDWYGKGGMYDTKNLLFKIFLGWYELKAEIWDKKIADGVILTSDVLVKRLLEVKPNAKYIKLFGGAPVETLPYLENNGIVKLKNGFNEGDLIIGYINAKNDSLDELIPLVEVLESGCLKYPVKVLIFGNDSGMSSILPNKLLHNFVFCGWIDFAKDYEILQCVDVFVLFKNETIENLSGWPNCIGDYLACGRHTLLNPTGELKGFVNIYPEGFIVTSNHPESVCKRLTYIAENMKSIISSRSVIRTIAENELSWSSKGNELLEFCLEILKIGKNKTL
jgi:glycosyltransferase involved in cell wall biosynthesis